MRAWIGEGVRNCRTPVQLAKLKPRQTDQEEAAVLADQGDRNRTFLNIPLIAGTDEIYIAHFQAAMQKMKAADPKAKKMKQLTPAQFKREAAKVKAVDKVDINKNAHTINEFIFNNRTYQIASNLLID